jgi:deoxycytidylate deaminase
MVVAVPPAASKPELVIGLVGAVGTDLTAARDAVIAALAPYRYRHENIKISGLMPAVKGGDYLRDLSPEDKRIVAYMDAGDEIRNQSERNDAMAALAVGQIADFREEHSDEQGAIPNTAYILDSLKHPKEVESLRSVYRDRFTLISVHSPTEARRDALQSKIAASHDEALHPERYAAVAAEIMDRDEHDDDHGFGQNVREAFVSGDVYVSTDKDSELKAQIERYFRLFFGDPFSTPTKDEYAMFQTHTAALRSSDLSRQVGAAVCTKEGEIIAVGCNEVPKADGGQYWPDDDPDSRDFQLGYDSNAKYRDEALQDAFERLKASGALAAETAEKDFFEALKGSRLTNLTEFGRPVHAEMAALLDAARRGAGVAGKKLFATTFPCHNCARHIIGAGITEVVYREPYEKSLAAELHKDAIVIDPATDPDGKVPFRRFVGIGPPKYLGLFAMEPRKDSKGDKVVWSEDKAVPRLVTTGPAAYLSNEDELLVELKKALEQVDLREGAGYGAT